MKIIIQLVIPTLSLLLVNAHYDDQYCNNLINNLRNNCTISSCCQLDLFSSNATSGVYKISRGSFGNAVDAYCDMTTDGGGWIVIQRNTNDNLVNFNTTWAEYEKGFGDLHTEFWYGLEEIHFLTKRGQWEMRVDYKHPTNTWNYIHYNNFSVGSASEEYPLTVGGFTGDDADWFNQNNEPLNGMKFSTLDNDNDQNNENCAADYRSGWWYDACTYSNNININRQPPSVPSYNGSVAIFTEMKIRPKDCNKQ